VRVYLCVLDGCIGYRKGRIKRQRRLRDPRKRKYRKYIDRVMTTGYVSLVACLWEISLAQKPAMDIVKRYGPAIRELEEEKGLSSMCCELIIA
jgi:hypothetical protein